MAYAIKVTIDAKDFEEKCKLHAKNVAFITLRDASKITREYGRGYAIQTLRNQISLGALRSKKLGKSVYVDWSMLLDFMRRKAG